MEILVNAADSVDRERRRRPATVKFMILAHGESENMRQTAPNSGFGGRKAPIVRARRGKWD
jgi:hypothetical protein